MEENWKDIEGFEGVYMVSNLGRVKSMNYNNTSKEGILKPGLNSSGYLQISLHSGGKAKNYAIHQLMAMMFLNHVLCGHLRVVDHIDENRLNNSLENLQIITSRENVARSIDKSKTSSQYRNVYWHNQRNKWGAKVNFNGKPHYLGLFTDEVEAHEFVERFRKENKIN